MSGLSLEKIEKKLKTEVIGKDIIFLDEIDSTNEYVKKIRNKEEGTVVLSSYQTGGKGRMGRGFFSPRDKGIYLSVILKPQIDIEKSLLITSFSALAVARAIESIFDVEIQIKWVNDLYLNNKKVCGILCESKIDKGRMEYVVLGIGLNVRKMNFPEELESVATSIENECNKKADINVLACCILEELDKLYKIYENGEFLRENEKRSNLMGRQIRVIKGKEEYEAKAIGLSDSGGLVIEKDGGKLVLDSGEVSIRVEGK